MQSYTRRQLKEDKFAKGTQEAVHWAVEHRPMLIWGGGALIVAVLVVFGLLTWTSRQSERANIELSKALLTLNAPLRPAGSPPDPTSKSFATSAERAKAAEKELKDIGNQYSLTKPGKMATYLAGTAAIQAGDSAEAERLLKSVADSSNRSIASLAELALANFYRSTNRAGDAIKLYRELADHPTDTVSKAQAQLELAQLDEASDPQEAAKLYQQIQKENPNSMAAQIAGTKLNNNK